MEHSESIGQLAAAKAKAQANFKPIKKDESADVFSQRTGKSYSYSYADLAQCLDAVVPALSDNELALFQPSRVVVEDGVTKVVALSMIVHVSGEWMKEEFTVPVVDATDARSIGSAATYAKRYGLQGLLALASEDDDGESARGGQHEMKDKEAKGPCPYCGVVGSIIKGKAEYGGGWLCWKKEGGCGAKWPDGPYPTQVVEEMAMPKEKLPAEGKPAAESKARASDPPVQASPSQPRVGSTKLRRVPYREERLVDSAPSEAGQASTEAPADSGPREPGTERPAMASAPDSGGSDGSQPSPLTFEIDGETYTTNGITREQFQDSIALVVQCDAKEKGYGRTVLAEILGVPIKKASRTSCTEAQASAWIAKMKERLA